MQINRYQAERALQFLGHHDMCGLWRCLSTWMFVNKDHGLRMMFQRGIDHLTHT